MNNADQHAQGDYEIAELGNPVLRAVACAVTNFSDPLLDRHLTAMHKLMTMRQGVGIAAPQVGVSLQILIVASRPNDRYPDAVVMAPEVMVNPKICWTSARHVKDWEGCLSIPGVRGLVSRPESVSVNYQRLDGSQAEVTWQGFPARIFLHEYDHLVGKTFIDQVTSSRDLYTEKEYLRLRPKHKG